MTQPQTTTVKLSTFVTTMAWFAVLSSGLILCFGLIQNIIFHLFVTPESLEDSLNHIQVFFPISPEMRNLISHSGKLIFIALLLEIFLFVASLHFLFRKEWARKFFVLVLGAQTLGSFWMAAEALMNKNPLGLGELSSVPKLPALPGIPEGMIELSQQLPELVPKIQMSIAVTSLIIGLLHGWIAIKLCSNVIRIEFGGKL